jgi:hypothetical protein
MADRHCDHPVVPIANASRNARRTACAPSLGSVDRYLSELSTPPLFVQSLRKPSETSRGATALTVIPSLTVSRAILYVRPIRLLVQQIWQHGTTYRCCVRDCWQALPARRRGSAEMQRPHDAVDPPPFLDNGAYLFETIPEFHENIDPSKALN